ncbi:MAG: RNA polymerase-binding protein RbpA [Bifidobacteriaceae bacterium]|jgi:crotonobetainyl-CoA:carnitine CoA-transferase CaiB-like acyl-CoA transferase|nr:RNA polymerase-binding protein RbpA [Bifidobacteriaceae bacterium]
MAHAHHALHGSTIGFQSLESEDGVDFAEHMTVYYDCPGGHVIVVPFYVEADVPDCWECRCGALALKRDVKDPRLPEVKHKRTHWEVLKERRTTEELEALLQERLELLRARRTPKGKRKAPAAPKATTAAKARKPTNCVKTVKGTKGTKAAKTTKTAGSKAKQAAAA